MKTVRITNSPRIDGIASVLMECDCGWKSHSYQHEAEPRAMSHLKAQHNKGQVHIDGVRYEVFR